MTQEITSKSALILRRYTPEEIQELLNSESKSSIVARLGLYMEALNKYIKEHNLTYNSGKKYIKQHVKKHKEILVKNLNSKETEDPVKRFYEMLAEKRAKRTLRELKNPYDW